MNKWQYCEIFWNKDDYIFITITGTPHIRKKIGTGEKEWPEILKELGEDGWELISTIGDKDEHWYHFKRPIVDKISNKIEGRLK